MIRTGIPSLDRCLAFDGGICTFRSPQRKLLDRLCRTFIINSLTPGKRTLVLHFSDYHDRYWAFDINTLIYDAKTEGADIEMLLDSTLFLRIFCRDGAEIESNWKEIQKTQGLGLVILDSASDLYSKEQRKPALLKGMLYTIARFGNLCAENSCPGIALDLSCAPIHPYLGERSAAIIEINEKDDLQFEIKKHPMLAETRTTVWRGDSLRRWL